MSRKYFISTTKVSFASALSLVFLSMLFSLYSCSNHVAIDGDMSSVTNQPSGTVGNLGPHQIQGFDTVYFICTAGNTYTMVNQDGTTSPHVCAPTEVPGTHLLDAVSPASGIICPSNGVATTLTFNINDSGYFYYTPCTPGQPTSFSLASGEWRIECPASGSFTYLQEGDFFGQSPTTYDCTPGEMISRQQLYPEAIPAYNFKFAFRCDAEHTSYGIRFTGPVDKTGQPNTGELFYYPCNSGQSYTFAHSSGYSYINILNLPVYEENSDPY